MNKLFSHRIANFQTVLRNIISDSYSLKNFSTSSRLFDKKLPIKSLTFASLFRDSPICQLGLPENKILVGEIVNVVDNDVYIDFGFKFLSICKLPKNQMKNYIKGARIKLKLNDLELSDRFLGSNQDMTLLEADATLIRLHRSPNKS
ncbi:28S ribosomal protein S28 [Sarcoptes scabiei]|uniref:28S ribosomal protein S28, mitochondrial n=1 Tax=Sarcoptes scabiei TaxID=52283 RepID=A0A834VG01_SARSC|nr:28S ribosomal protein S28 [Sarcoptes scabiei]UXI21842.1 serine/threonine-protein kinase N [Sarcoptes scabiei]